MELPLFFNVPNRNNIIKKHKTRKVCRTDADSDHYGRSISRLRDYNLLALACQRGGKLR